METPPRRFTPPAASRAIVNHHANETRIPLKMPLADVKLGTSRGVFAAPVQGLEIICPRFDGLR
jgi:hypothetical protein